MIPREGVFKLPHVAAANLHPRGSYILCRPEDPPSRDCSIWTPGQEEKLGIGFVLYGSVIAVGPGDYKRDLFVPTSVKPGQRVVWSHGWGPSLELRDGTHFLVLEQGVHAVWDAEHVHCWHIFDGSVSDRGSAEARCCGCAKQDVIATSLPGCPRDAGPRLAEAIVGRDPQKLEAQAPLADPRPVSAILDDREPVGERFKLA